MDAKLVIRKQVWVRCPSNRDYSVDRHDGIDGKPDYFVLTEHKKRGGKRFRVVILEPDLQKIVAALQEAAK